MPPILIPRTSAATTDLTIVITSVLTIAVLIAIIFTHFHLRRRRRARDLIIRSRTPRTHPASIPSDKPPGWRLGNTATTTTTAARRLSAMTCRASMTVESLRRVAKERVRLKARVGDIRAGNLAISAPRDARTEEGARLSKFPFGLDAPLPPPPSAQNLGQAQRDGEGYGLRHGQHEKPMTGPDGFGLPNNRHAVVGDNASDVHPLYRGGLEHQSPSSNNRAHPHTNMNIQKVTPGRCSPNPAGHGYEYADPGDNTFLHGWHPDLSPLNEDSQLPLHPQVHEDRITSSPSPPHAQPQPRATSPVEITEYRDLIERLHRFGVASSSSSTPSCTSPKPVQKPLPPALENLRLEEEPVEKRTDPETPRTAAFSLRRREAERIAQARYMRSFSPTQRGDEGGVGKPAGDGGATRSSPTTRKLRHRSSDTELAGSLYSRFSRHRQGPIQRDLGRDLGDRREWKWEWELDEDRNVDLDRDLEKGGVLMPQVEEDGSLSDPRPDGPFPPRRASLGFGFESVGVDSRPVVGATSAASLQSLGREKEKSRRVVEEQGGGQQEGTEKECWATRPLKKKRGKGDFENEGGIVRGVSGEKGNEDDGLEEYLALVGKDTGYERQRVGQKNARLNRNVHLDLPDRSDKASPGPATSTGRDPENDATTLDTDTQSLAAFTHPSITPQPLVVRKIPSLPRTIHVQHAVEYGSPRSSPHDGARSWEGGGEKRARSPEMMNGTAILAADPEGGPTWGVRNRDVSPESAAERHSADDLVEGLAGLGVRMERTANGLSASRSERDISPTSNYSDKSISSLGLPMQSPDTSPDVDQGGVEESYKDVDEGRGDDYHTILRTIHSPSALPPPRLPSTRYGERPPSSEPAQPPSPRLQKHSYTSSGRPKTAIERTEPPPRPPPQPHPQQQLELQIPSSRFPSLNYRIDPHTSMEPQHRASLTHSTWEADLLSSYTTSAPAAPPPAPNPTNTPIPFPQEHSHIMPGPSPGALRRVAEGVDGGKRGEGEKSEERRGISKGETDARQNERLGLMTGTVEEGGRGWF